MSSGTDVGGVYEISNLVNGKRYIGSAVSFKKRWGVHRSYLRKGTHHSKKLQSAWAKYGETAFRFNPLLVCGKSDLVFFEQRCLDSMAPEYNLCKVAGSQLGVKHTPEWIENAHGWRRGIKTGPQSPEWIESRIRHCRGRPQSKEHVERRVASLRGRKRTPLPAEQRAKIAESCRVFHRSRRLAAD